LVLPSTSVKSSEQTQALLVNGTIGMQLSGNWQIPFLQKDMTKYGWDVTYSPRRGHGLRPRRQLRGGQPRSKYRDIAVDFLKFAVDENNMRGSSPPGNACLSDAL
jgi:ABC-type glycerol-3-phosphate transport system substrate-binding protein